ncbi:MAG: hypothetical protein ACYS47_06805 [Planctomycetota bacterium]|jgi:hypothetical protein
MRNRVFALVVLLISFALVSQVAFARDRKRGKDKEKPNLNDPELIGEEVTDQTENEKLLFTEYRKRRNKHFFLETSFDMDTCKDYIAFAELMYREFLEWAGKPADYELWPSRIKMTVINNKAEWECLMKNIYKNDPPHLLEKKLKLGGSWWTTGMLQYSRDGSTPESDKLSLYHKLNHVFLHGLAKSGHNGTVWWLWEAFSWHRALEKFGSRGGGCITFKTAAKTEEDRAWNDIDDWVSLLKRDVRTKQDEDFVLFWHKDLSAVQGKTWVKAWSLVRYFLKDKEHKAKFIQFIEMLKTHNHQAKAMTEAFALKLDKSNPTAADKIDRDWRSWIKRQPSRWRKRSRKKGR